MKTWQTLALGVLFGLLAAGLILLVGLAPRGKAIHLAPASTQSPITVQVAGAVQNPGVFQMTAGARVQDAIMAAGGLTTEAQAETLNLATPLQDGQKIWVPLVGEETPTTIPQPSASGNQSIPGLVNINTASLEELDGLPGIGPTRAQDILNYRAANGPFKSIEDINNVPGIGEVIFGQIKDLITVGE
jgi:competence protein ComEA